MDAAWPRVVSEEESAGAGPAEEEEERELVTVAGTACGPTSHCVSAAYDAAVWKAFVAGAGTSMGTNISRG